MHSLKRTFLPVLMGLGLFLLPANLLAAPPNVMVMLADDMGYGDLSIYGSLENHTPNLDKLASEGARFTDFYAGSAVCSPSRAALITGRFSVRAGIYSWVHTSQNMHLRREEITIAEVLKEKGYSTAHLGKWHLCYDLVKGSGTRPNPGDQGFDYWMATGNNAEPSHHNPTNFVKNGVALGKVEGYSCQIVVDEAETWLDQHRDKSKPFFMNLWFHEPHMKVAAPEKFRNRHLDTKRPDYYGCIENLDDAIGRLLAKLDKMGVSDNTLIVFTSENGSYMQGSNDPLKGRKTQLWEGGIREPAIMRWPGHIQPDSVITEPTGVVDILPTICEATGASVPKDRVIDGVSLLPLFSNKRIKRNHPLYWFYNPSRPVCAIREGDWALIADPTIDLPRGNMFKEEYIGNIKETELTNFRLFNLRQDPIQDDEITEHAKLNQMKAKMLKLHREVVTEAYDWRNWK